MATTVIGIFRAGKGSRMLVGGNIGLKGKKIGIEEQADDLDTTNFECYTTAYGFTLKAANVGRSFSQGLIGTETASGSFDGSWDFSRDMFADPPGIYNREDGPRHQAIPSRTNAAIFYDFPATRIFGPTIDLSVKDVVNLSYKFKNQGPYKRPTGFANV